MFAKVLELSKYVIICSKFLVLVSIVHTGFSKVYSTGYDNTYLFLLPNLRNKDKEIDLVAEEFCRFLFYLVNSSREFLSFNIQHTHY